MPRKPKLGQITFRLPAELHAEMLEVARLDDVDVSDLLRCVLARHLPSYRARAESRKEEPGVKERQVEQAKQTQLGGKSRTGNNASRRCSMPVSMKQSPWRNMTSSTWSPARRNLFVW